MKLKGTILAAAMFFSFSCYKLPATNIAALNAEDYNPCNKQDDMEVPYDGSYWIQPLEWNVPTVNPRGYNGGIMLFFDKISFDAEYVKGKTQRVYFTVHGATEAVNAIKFHIFYDTRLKVKEKENGEVVSAGKSLNGFTTGSKLVEDGEIAFYAYNTNDTLLSNGSILTIDFIIPEDAEQGEVYPIGLAYVDDGIAADTFINRKKDDAGRLQMTYVFTKGIYNGYIKMNGEKITTTATTTVTTTTTTTTTFARPVEPNKYELGDVNNDSRINALDATSVLTHYAMISTNKNGELDENQQLAADVDHNGAINAADASFILSYYAYTSTSSGDLLSFEEFMKQ